MVCKLVSTPPMDASRVQCESRRKAVALMIADEHDAVINSDAIAMQCYQENLNTKYIESAKLIPKTSNTAHAFIAAAYLTVAGESELTCLHAQGLR